MAQQAQEGRSGLAEDVIDMAVDDISSNAPPKDNKCFINQLPHELLALIFRIGAEASDDEDDEDDEDEDDSEADRLMDTEPSEPTKGDGDSTGEGMVLGTSEKLQMLQQMERDISAMKEGMARVARLPVTSSSGVESDEEDDDNTDYEGKPFQVLVSHVCKHWRALTLDMPQLWTTLTFSDGPPFERSRACITRSKSLPLEICIDITVDSDDEDEEPNLHYLPPIFSAIFGLPKKTMPIPQLIQILDMIVPHVDRWRVLDVRVSYYVQMYCILSRLSMCPPAPLLEDLELFHYEDCEDYDAFKPSELATPFILFQGCAPKLQMVAFWGVHLDWERCLGFLQNLQVVEFAYHAQDVRPTFDTFAAILRSSPEIKSLRLGLSGPRGDPQSWPTEDVIQLHSLTELALSYHDITYLRPLFLLLDMPNVRNLALAFDNEDYSEFGKMLATPQPGRSKSFLSGVAHLKITDMPCDDNTIHMMYRELSHIKSLNLNCSGAEDGIEDADAYFRILVKGPQPPMSSIGSAQEEAHTQESAVVYLPQLDTLTSTGISGERIKLLVEARETAGFPLKRVYLSDRDRITNTEKKWLRKHLETLDFFEPSDDEFEDEIVEVDIDAIPEDDGDEEWEWESDSDDSD